MDNNKMMTATNWRWQNYLFWAVALALLFFQLGGTAPWQSEDRWLQIAREMIDSGSFFHPTLNGKLYFDKPLLTYWFVIAASALTNGLNEWSLRLPSALSALLALWGTRHLGRQLLSANIGNTAGWILLTSFGFLQWGRLGEADMENLAATIVAVTWYWRYRDRSEFIGYFVAYLVMAVGAQCKGLTAVVVPLGAILIDTALNKRWRLHVNWRNIAAAAIAFSIYLLPFIFATEPQQVARTDGLALVLRENIVRYVAPFDHTEPFYTYLVAIPEYLFPWTFLFIGAVIASGKRTRDNTYSMRWLALTTAFIFVFFTLSGSRRNYYILPILPYCALLAAHYLRTYPSRAIAVLRWSAGLCFLLFALLAAPPFVLPKFAAGAAAHLPSDLLHNAALIGIFGIAILILLWFDRQRFSDNAFFMVIACALVLFCGFFFRLQLDIDSVRTEVPFARALRPLAAQAATPIAIVNDKPSGRLLFYAALPRPVSILDNQQAIAAFIATPPYPKLLLAYQKDNVKLPSALQQLPPTLNETTYAWEKDQREKLQAWLIRAPLNY